MKKYIQVLILLCGALGGSLAQAQIVSNTGGGLLWNNTGSWSTGVIPGPDDDVIIADGAIMSVESNETVEVRSLTVGQSNPMVNTVLTVRDGATFVINENCVVNTGSYDDEMELLNRKFIRVGTATVGTGINTLLKINGDLTVAAVNNDYAGVILIGEAQLELGGNMVLPNGGGFLNAPSSATVTLSGSSPQQIYIGGDTQIEYPNLVVDGDSVSFYSGNGTGGKVKGELRVKNGAFDNSGKALIVDKDIIIEESGTFRLTGPSTISVTSATSLALYGKLFTEHAFGLSALQTPGTIIMGSETEVEFGGTATGQRTGFDSIPLSHVFPRIIFGNPNGTKLEKDLRISNLEIKSGAIFLGGEPEGTPHTIAVKNTWLNNGTFTGYKSTVLFETGDLIQLQGNGVNNFGSIRIDSNTTLSAPGELIVTTDFTVRPGSRFLHNNGRVVFNPSINGASTSGVGQFYDLRLNRGVNFAGNDTINGELYLGTGTISSISGSLALNLNTGYINHLGNGTFNPSDSITFFKNVSHKGYSYLSFPISTTTASLKSRGFNHVFSFDETRNPLYLEYQTNTNLLADGRGYPCFATYTEPVIRLKGQYDFARTNVPVSLTSTLVEGEIVRSRTGWNLIGNPYAFNLDWDVLRGSQDIYSSVYFYNGTTYSSYVGGVPASGYIIAPMQAFMVFLPNETSGNKTSTFNISKSAGLQGTSPLFRKALPDNVLKLQVAGNGSVDAAYVRLSDDATTGFDPDFDAYKFKNTGNAASFYSVLNGENYSINSVPATFSSFSLPLSFEAKVGGAYTITLSEEYAYDLPYEIYLEDKLMNVLHPIASEPSYTFSTNLNEDAKRFILHFNSPVITGMIGNAKFVQVFTEENRSITIRGIEVDELAKVMLYDLTGRIIAQYDNVDLKNKSFNLRSATSASGVYIVNVVSGEKSHAERVVLY